MPAYPTKTSFLAEGVTSCSVPDDQPDCPICMDPLSQTHPTTTPPSTANDAQATAPRDRSAVTYFHTDLNTMIISTNTVMDTSAPRPATTAPASAQEDHTPIKVSCCNNVFGRQCLEFWLRRNNTCPFCRAELFPRISTRDRLVDAVEAAVASAIRSAVAEFLQDDGDVEELRELYEEGYSYYNVFEDGFDDERYAFDDDSDDDGSDIPRVQEREGPTGLLYYEEQDSFGYPESVDEEQDVYGYPEGDDVVYQHMDVDVPYEDTVDGLAVPDSVDGDAVAADEAVAQSGGRLFTLA